MASSDSEVFMYSFCAFIHYDQVIPIIITSEPLFTVSNHLPAKKMTKPAVRSLQSQYIYVASLLGSLVLIGTALGYFNIITTSSSLLNKAETTSRILNQTTAIRQHTSKALSSIQAFMLDPDEAKHKVDLHISLDQSENILESISEEEFIHEFRLNTAHNTLLTNLNTLRSKSTHLFNVRTSSNEQYPALSISSEIMLPIRNDIISSLNLALLELKEAPRFDISSEEYLTLNETLLAWTTTLAEYRLFLTNRMGSFDPHQLLDHEKSVNSHIEQVMNLALKLEAMNQQNRFGFQGSNLIRHLPGLVDAWKNAFSRVQEINHSDAWRQDIKLFTQQITPLLNSINRDLTFIDDKVKQVYQETLRKQTSASTTQTTILFGIILLFIVYIVFSIKLLQRFIIKPIATMASALKDEAYHHGSFHSLHLTRTKETQDLIDAFNEMSHQVFKRQDELEYQAMHDSLTGLPNRLMLHQRLDYHLLIACREKQKLSFMMLDLNRFKEINDTLGHHIGDNMLVQIGERISNKLRSVDTIARLGGDEFAILLPNTSRDQARVAAENIHKCLEEPFIVNEYDLQISSSIGIAEFPADGKDSHELMQHADVAMYISKREKTQYHYYSATEDSHSITRLSLGADLKLAIENDQLTLHYQPKYRMQSGEIIGAEALLRWNHPVSGLIPPEVIVGIAEEMGLINDLSHWVINNALSFCGSMQQQGYLFAISINLSVQNLRDPDLSRFIEKGITRNALDSGLVSFEITESAMMTNPEKSIQALNKLHQLGVALSIDDFGTGFSSLAYLKLLPVNELKIDKSFVMDMEQDESDRLIVRSTIELSHNLGLKVVAEGVETQACWDMLSDMGCDTAQGYFMSRPLDAEHFAQLLTAHPQIASNH